MKAVASMKPPPQWSQYCQMPPAHPAWLGTSLWANTLPLDEIGCAGRESETQ